MNLVDLLLYTVLFMSSAIIIYQDFKDRLVSVWVLSVLALSCISSVIYYRGMTTLLHNAVFTLIYMVFLWLILKLYLFLKHKRNIPIINHQFGLADAIAMFCIGLTFNEIGIVLFFCSGFIFSLFVFLVYVAISKRANKSIPLAGLLVFYYLSILIILDALDIGYLIDCSFVNP